ncbi:MAG: hypothetical protein JXR75_13320 [Rhodobacteraceae bacterium]|nr:hypothetical protein [Paracoccaceae bacterium]
MRFPALLLFPLAVAACAPPVPDSGAGVGFQDYNSYVRDRELAASRAQPIVPPGFSTDSIGAAIDRTDGQGAASQPSTGAVIGAPSTPQGAALDANRPRGGAPVGIKEESGEMAALRKPGISDENDFAAVSQRETIESDRARIDRNRAQYQVVQPGALPVRPGAQGPNIVDYALATSHPRGTQLYKRSGFGGNAAAKCAGYTSPDLAQEAFLAKGGPERDRLGLDPDGDGYACAWDPSPFRLR